MELPASYTSDALDSPHAPHGAFRNVRALMCRTRGGPRCCYADPHTEGAQGCPRSSPSSEGAARDFPHCIACPAAHRRPRHPARGAVPRVQRAQPISPPDRHLPSGTGAPRLSSAYFSPRDRRNRHTHSCATGIQGSFSGSGTHDRACSHCTLPHSIAKDDENRSRGAFARFAGIT